jgi:hypothetical protein
LPKLDIAKVDKSFILTYRFYLTSYLASYVNYGAYSASFIAVFTAPAFNASKAY